MSRSTEPTTAGESPIEFLTGEAEVQYAHEQMWGSYWTGARLIVASAAMLFGCFLFAFFYLRSLDSDHDWYIHGQAPSVTLGGFVLAMLILSAAVASLAAIRLRRSAAALDWLVGSSIALALGLLAAGFQAWQMGRLHFQPGYSGYSSVFVGWQIIMILAMLGGAYWLETLIARGVRVRRVLRPIAFSANEPDVTMFRGSLDGFIVYWNFLALVEVVVFILFYAVH